MLYEPSIWTLDAPEEIAHLGDLVLEEPIPYVPGRRTLPLIYFIA